MKNRNYKNLYQLFIVCIISCFILSSCSSIRITTRGAVAVTNSQGETERFKTIHVFVGQIKTWDEDLCNGAALAEVSVRPNVLYSFLNVVSLGIWKPVRVSYKCNEECN